MHLINKNTKQSYQLPQKNHVIVGSARDCDIHIPDSKIDNKHFSIIQEPYGLIIEVFGTPIEVNGKPYKEMCLLHLGDFILINDICLIVYDEQFVPKEPKKLSTKQNSQHDKIHTSVYGIRSFNKKDNGHFIIDDIDFGDGWKIIRQADSYVFCKNAKKQVYINGQLINCCTVSNGDIVSNKNFKYVIELPGSSGFSKFSPSHPDNMLLSEQIIESTNKPIESPTNMINTLKKNAWWMTLSTGLLALIIIVFTR